ncbi:MAG: hypothetical protein ACRES5_09280 [Pseudomonas sp.]|uniref:hypothetical protein n=1 Tax=Stenotrophomonas sp. TaxID=69392 RepID=UPI003D6C8B00
MNIAWRVAAMIAVLCGVLSAWLLFTAGAGTRMLAGAQLFVAGAISSVVCTGIAATLEGSRRRLIGVALVGVYGLALLGFMAASGNLR